MKERLKIEQAEPRIFKAMYAAEKELAGFELDPKLKGLIKIRVSQINGCAYCIDMHTKEAIKLGETEQRLYTLCAWWETPFFTEKERAAIKLAEEVTRISKHGVSDDVYDDAIKHFGEQETAQIIFTAVVINGWNRIAVSAHTVTETDE